MTQATSHWSESTALLGTTLLAEGRPARGFYFHHQCYNAVSYALRLGSDARVQARMTVGFARRTAPAQLLTEFDERVGRGRVHEGNVSNLKFR